MKVLIACEYSGRVRDAFLSKGHDAISCDILPTDSPGPHYQGDVRELLDHQWDLIIAHPPCTYLTNSGVRWLKTDPERWQALDEAAAFFRLFLETDAAEKVAIENPIMHKYAIERIGGIKHTQTIQPWQFGDMESKRTCLWLRNLPELKETNNVYEEMMQLPIAKRNRVHHCPPSDDRWKIRSTTFQGIANAMAEQWNYKDD